MSTDWRTEYSDLCNEIEILEIRASDLERQLSSSWKQCYNGIQMPLDKAVVWNDEAKEKLLDVVNEIEHKKQTRMLIESKLGEFKGLEYQVAYNRDILRKPLTEIAEELGYSYGWIMKVSMRVKRLKGRKKEESA
ncbi:hypothetical protein QFZ77_002444 [Paenibacillus sp. V4I3]|uniref:hypothetical protein n=1 Tax=Paenibacillus sp. V4I3 TaxID=3042305 RepID=UPI002782361C|nr:hypothetical protein [Paenibacillus sp. V4I3]MDQ0873785.1 hypothetical protein [Paenibacillus sp. V4I3]